MAAVWHAVWRGGQLLDYGVVLPGRAARLAFLATNLPFFAGGITLVLQGSAPLTSCPPAACAAHGVGVGGAGTR